MHMKLGSYCWPIPKQAARRGQFIGDIAGELTVEVEDGFRLVEGMEHHSPQHQRAHSTKAGRLWEEAM
jgi:hypothetical protein